MNDAPRLDALDRALVLATQSGLPIVERPYAQIGAPLGLSGDEVIHRLAAMIERGEIRRIGAVPNHYRLGYRANGMTVWDIDDERVDELGALVGTQPFVTHCYRRPRHLPHWPYNLFAMIHARTRDEAQASIDRLVSMVGHACRSHDVLYSTRILKKTGVRLGAVNAVPSGDARSNSP